MARSTISPSKALLLAVQLVTKGDYNSLRILVSQHKTALRLEVILRIILSYSPESTPSAEYVPFIQDLVEGSIQADEDATVDASALEDLPEEEAHKKARKLKLTPLKWQFAPDDLPEDPVVQFLIHRASLVDQSTGLITQLPELIAPFLGRSEYLRTWFISTILPLLRFNYEYYPGKQAFLSISDFERLDNEAGVALLLSKTGKEEITMDNRLWIGRDLRGLIGPWMYGDARWKRIRLRKHSAFNIQTIADGGEAPPANSKCAGWEEVFKWMTAQASKSWKTAVETVEQWDGPGDVDLGVYGDGRVWLDEEDLQYLERRYARSAIAAAYLVSDGSLEALLGVHRIVSKIISLLDLDKVPSLQAGANMLTPVSGLEGSALLGAKQALSLRKGLLDEDNLLTKPTRESITLLHAVLTSAFLCTRAGCSMIVKRALELSLLQNEREQKLEYAKLMVSVGNGPKGDDKYWVRMRHEILWLRTWGAEDLNGGIYAAAPGKGIFGQISKDFLEAEILKALLKNTRYSLAQSIYENSTDRPLSLDVLKHTVFTAAMDAYDNATNANKTRGGVKRCQEILQAFPALTSSSEANKMQHLIKVTHAAGEHRIVFKQGEPFRPVMLRVHNDPIGIIGKILEQNPKSYTKITEFVDMGKDMVKAGLTEGKTGSTDGPSHGEAASLEEQLSIAEKRVVSMCIDAALAEDDFETAYSYVMTHLKNIAGPAQSFYSTPDHHSNSLAVEPPPKTIDDWSWKAALQAGKHRRTSSMVRPTHVGNASGNLEIRHLEQRMECLAQALRLAPRSTLQEILNVYRRCEEELESQVRQEAEQEAAWDAQGDEQAMPGAFSDVPHRNSTSATTKSRATEEAPMSLFDLSRASVAGLSLSLLKGNKASESKTSLLSSLSPSLPNLSPGLSRTSTPDSAAGGNVEVGTRKRDQLKKAAVGTLASGIGWVLGAPPAVKGEGEDVR